MTKLAYTSMGVEIAKVVNKVNSINKDLKEIGLDDLEVLIKSEVIVSIDYLALYKSHLKLNGINLSIREIIELEQVMAMISNTTKVISVNSSIRTFGVEVLSSRIAEVVSNNEAGGLLAEKMNLKQIYELMDHKVFDMYHKADAHKHNDYFKLHIKETSVNEFNEFLDNFDKQVSENGVVKKEIYKDMGLSTNVLKIIEVFDEKKLENLTSKYKPIINKILKGTAKEYLKTNSSYYYNLMGLDKKLIDKFDEVQWEYFYNSKDESLKERVESIRKMLRTNNWSYEFKPIINLFEKGKDDEVFFKKGLEKIESFQDIFFQGYEIENPIHKIMNGWRTVNSPKTTYDTYSLYSSNIEGYLVAKIDKASEEDKKILKNRYRDFIAEIVLLNPILKKENKFSFIELIEKNFTEEQKKKVYEKFEDLKFNSEKENWFNFNIDNGFSKVEIDSDYFQFNKVNIASTQLTMLLNNMHYMDNFMVDYMVKIADNKCKIMFEHSEFFKTVNEKKKKDMILSVLDAICASIKEKYDNPSLKDNEIVDICLNHFKELNMFILLNNKEKTVIKKNKI